MIESLFKKLKTFRVHEEKLKRKSIDQLKEIAKLRRIKDRDKLKKEALITSILISESSNAERNYMKHFTMLIIITLIMMLMMKIMMVK